MQLVTKHFPEVLLDNDLNYLFMLEGVIDSVDELAILQVTKISDGYQFRLSASLPKFNPLLIEEILKLHNVFNIHLDLSKSIKTSGVVSYKIIL